MPNLSLLVNFTRRETSQRLLSGDILDVSQNKRSSTKKCYGQFWLWQNIVLNFPCTSLAALHILVVVACLGGGGNVLTCTLALRYFATSRQVTNNVLVGFGYIIYKYIYNIFHINIYVYAFVSRRSVTIMALFFINFTYQWLLNRDSDKLNHSIW